MSAVLEMPLKAKEAAEFVGLHPVTLIERARRGIIPGAAKPGKEWIFPVEGLRAYRNSLSPCPYTGEETSGGSSYPQNREELESLLGLPTRKRRRNTTKRESRRYGAREN